MIQALAYMGLEPGMKMEGLPIDYAFIGSCTNSRLSDLQAAAAVIRGRKIPESVTGLVVPGSSQVKAAAEAIGLDRIFKDAGFQWREVRMLHVPDARRRLRAARAALHLDLEP